MPNFWQISETANDQIQTLFVSLYLVKERRKKTSTHGNIHLRFDIAFASGTTPLFETRATFLTGSILDSVRGFRARKQGRIPTTQVTKDSAWHLDLRPTLSRISPAVFNEAALEQGEVKEPYSVVRGEEMPLVDRFEMEARERLALDLVLAADVYSGLPFQNATAKSRREKEVDSEEREDTLLTQAAERLSLDQGPGLPVPPSPPSHQQRIPQMQFGFLKPIKRDPSRHYRTTDASTHSSNSRERASFKEELGPSNSERKDTVFDPRLAEEPELPPGVRLLLSEWNVGESPNAYTYVDPYGLDDNDNITRAPALARMGRKGGVNTSSEGTGGADQVKWVPVTRAPPTIVASQPKLNAVGPSRAPTQSQALAMTTQTQSIMSSSQPFAMPQTQVLPGPFGGRQSVAKKKPPKKRIGGF